MNLKTLFPHGSNAFFSANAPVSRSLPTTEPQQNKTKPLGKAVPRKEKSLGRTTVSFRGFSVRPLDPDGFAGSIKDLLDGLWRCGAIHGDSFWQIKLVTEQEKVDHFADERIEIQITYP